MKKISLSKNRILSLLSNDVFTKYSLVADVDDLTLKSGIYAFNNYLPLAKALNTPAGAMYGVLLVFNGTGIPVGGAPVVQIIIPDNATIIYLRLRWDTTSTPWRKLTTI